MHAQSKMKLFGILSHTYTNTLTHVCAQQWSMHSIFPNNILMRYESTKVISFRRSMFWQSVRLKPKSLEHLRNCGKDLMIAIAFISEIPSEMAENEQNITVLLCSFSCWLLSVHFVASQIIFSFFKHTLGRFSAWFHCELINQNFVMPLHTCN